MLNVTKDVIHQPHCIFIFCTTSVESLNDEMKYHYPCVLSFLLNYHIVESWDGGLLIVSFLFISEFVALG